MKRLLALLIFLAAPASAGSGKASYMHYIQGLLLQQKGLYTEALKEFQQVVDIDPQSGYVLEQAAELALDVGQSTAALEFATQMAELEPKNPKAHLVLGNVRWAQSDPEGAEKSFAVALKLQPKYEEALFAMGNLLAPSEPLRARGYFERYLSASDEGSPEVLYQLALIDQRLGNTPRAVENLQRAIEVDAEFLQARYALAQIYEVAKDTDAALAEYKGILPHDPKNLSLMNHVGELLFFRGRIDEAEASFDQVKALEPGNPAACFWKAFLAEQRKDWARAAAELRASTALDDDAGLVMRLSYYLTQAGRLGDAVDVLSQARTKWPKDPEIAYFLGLGYDDLGQVQKAIEAMNGTLALKPDSREARFQLATLYEKAGNVEEMEKQFRLLLRSRPDDASALNYLGYSLADRGLKLAEARALIERAVALEPDNGAYADSLGWADFKLGDYAKANEELLRAAEMVDSDETVWEHLGDSYNASKDSSRAWLAYKLSQFIKPGSSALSKKIGSVESHLSASDLGRLELEHLRRTHGRMAEVHGLCQVEGTVGPNQFTFVGLLGYKDGAPLQLDVLGPMFVPLWRVSVQNGAVDLGGFSLPQIPQDALERAASGALRLVGDYFTGRLYDAKEAKYKRGWTRSYVETEDYTLFVVDRDGRLASYRPRGERSLRVELPEARLVHGRSIPAEIRVSGQGFSLSIKLERVSAEFAKGR